MQRVFAMDEARFGLKVTHRRLWCPFGSRPPGSHDHQYHWLWLYAAVEPVSGTCFVLFLPHVDGVCFQRFLEEFRKHTGTDRIGLVLDNSGSHTSGKVRWPEGIEKIPLPPYSPELNPVERVWEYLRDRWLSHRMLAGGYEAVVDAACAAWNALLAEPRRLRSLTNFTWLAASVTTS